MERGAKTDSRELARQQWDVKCAKCKKPGNQHNSVTRACPMGRKHRTFGYSSFSSKDVFTDPRAAGLSADQQEQSRGGEHG